MFLGQRRRGWRACVQDLGGAEQSCCWRSPRVASAPPDTPARNDKGCVALWARGGLERFRNRPAFTYPDNCHARTSCVVTWKAGASSTYTRRTTFSINGGRRKRCGWRFRDFWKGDGETAEDYVISVLSSGEGEGTAHSNAARLSPSQK